MEPATRKLDQTPLLLYPGDFIQQDILYREWVYVCHFKFLFSTATVKVNPQLSRAF